MRRHRLDPFSLVFGLTFLVMGVAFAVGRTDASRLHLEWLWPIPIIALGALLIAMALRGDRSAVTAAPAPESAFTEGPAKDGEPDE